MTVPLNTRDMPGGSGAQMASLEKPRHISETGWTWGLLASGQISPAVGPKYEQQDTKRPKPNYKAVS